MSQDSFKIPKLLKTVLPLGFEEKALEKVGAKFPAEMKEKLQLLHKSTRSIIDEGPTENNYMTYFHHLLWWEEIVARINLRKYNMFGVRVEMVNNKLIVEVPGLAEKRPSLLKGDRVYLLPKDTEIIFESVINDIMDSHIRLSYLDPSLQQYHYTRRPLYDIRFRMSRVTMERMHEAVSLVFSNDQGCRIFPTPPTEEDNRERIHIEKFMNPLIECNPEQKSAVEHIVSGTAGKAPYIVFGPPGTGKTMTIVEAIVQLVMCNDMNRLLVCTESNMAADHVAMMLLPYCDILQIPTFVLRANSRSREWSSMPEALAHYSNGYNTSTFFTLSNAYVSKFRIVVTTLSHAAKYGLPRNQQKFKLEMTHLFIDEAGQASEPACLVPITNLLSPEGYLILAGDPKQLGPVCVSEARQGLGRSLLERLKETYVELYNDNPNYTTMLVQNFRSNPDILALPNELFYDNCLKAYAPSDPLSLVSILGLEGGKRAVVFHAVNSQEQRMGNTPSYFNVVEIDMLKRYVSALIVKHAVEPYDIGIIAPYIKQVYKIKDWLASVNYKIEVGTVESFQGKEKRVILVSTVRANCKLLDYDARYGLGFLVDDKRYNVTLTRAKAKLIIIGNPICLTRDSKWRKLMEFTRKMDCYYVEDSTQIEQDSHLLTEIEKCRITEFVVP